MATSAKTQVRIELRRFDPSDFERLIAWVPTREALGQWCASFFTHPLDEAQLLRYLKSAAEPNNRTIFAAVAGSGEVVGHAEISNTWPHLSSRLSRVLVAPGRRGQGIGGAIFARAIEYSFNEHGVDRIDLGVASDNVVAIACYHAQGFKHVGTWPQAMQVGSKTIDVHWMTIGRSQWTANRAERSAQYP